MSLKQILEKIQDEVKRREEARQEVHADARAATRLSKMAILMAHQRKFDEAEKKLKEAGDLFSRIVETSKNNVDLLYSGMVDAAFQEHAEASIFLRLVKEDRFIGPEEIGVTPSAYVLSLADVIGELRRKVLDSLRDGETSLGEKYLEIMDLIYIELMGMGDAYFLLSGLRRKCDVARRIIETTRGDVTIEMRRRSLEDSLQRFQKTLEER